jgi:hypothetical protein
MIKVLVEPVRDCAFREQTGAAAAVGVEHFGFSADVEVAE